MARKCMRVFSATRVFYALDVQTRTVGNLIRNILCHDNFYPKYRCVRVIRKNLKVQLAPMKFFIGSKLWEIEFALDFSVSGVPWEMFWKNLLSFFSYRNPCSIYAIRMQLMQKFIITKIIETLTSHNP